MQKKVDSPEIPSIIAAMQNNKAFAEIIGQESVKATLSLYISAYGQTSRLPFLNFQAARGCGKTHIVKKFRSALKRPDGTRPPLLEVNCSSIKNMRAFMEQVYPTWVNNNAFLFLDEVHNAPRDLQQMFLTLFNVDRSPQRTIQFEGIPYSFDFTKIAFASASTDHQKLCEPLRDRLRNIALEEYKESELFEIFEQNLEYRVDIDPSAKQEIASTFRGNPRDVVVKAEDLKTFAAAQKIKKIDSPAWRSFCKIMGVNPFGLSHAEMKLIKILGSKGESTLTTLASVTGFDAQAIRRDYEAILFRKGLIVVDGKRKLTADGMRFYHQHCK